MRFSFIASLGLGWFCVLGVTGCDQRKAESKPAPAAAEARPVQVVAATRRPMERALQVVGTLAAREEASIAAQVAGQLEKHYVELGDKVQAGQELALIDTTSYEALANASAANLARANASAANAAQNLKRTQELQKEKIASSSELDAAVADAARTRSEVKAAEASDAIAHLNLERSRVRAPFPGVIAERQVSAGDYLPIGAPIVRLVQTDPLRLRLEVPERESTAVRVGQPVRLTLEGDTNVYRGQLTRIAPAIRPNDRMLIVEADVRNTGGLRAGLFARAAIIVEEHQEAVSVPQTALITFAGLEKVVVAREGKAAEKTVATGRREGDWVEILSGLNSGELVVLKPAGLRTGQALIVTHLPSHSVTVVTNRLP